MVVHFQLFELVYVKDFSKICSTNPFSQFWKVKNKKPRQWLLLCVQSVLWRVQLHIMQCSLKKLLLIAAWVFSSLWYLVTVCRLPSKIGKPQELLARSFIVSATTLEFKFSSACPLASTADYTKLLKRLFGIYSTKRYIFLQTSPSWN